MCDGSLRSGSQASSSGPRLARNGRCTNQTKLTSPESETIAEFMNSTSKCGSVQALHYVALLLEFLREQFTMETGNPEVTLDVNRFNIYVEVYQYFPRAYTIHATFWRTFTWLDQAPLQCPAALLSLICGTKPQTKVHGDHYDEIRRENVLHVPCVLFLSISFFCSCTRD